MSNSLSIINPVDSTIIIQWNVKSLTARLPILQYILSHNKCSIALISEIWLLPARSINIPNYVSFRADHQDGYGDATIIIHNSLRSRPISIVEDTQNDFSNFKIDIVGVEVTLLNSSTPLRLWSSK